MIKKRSPTVAGYLLNTWVLVISTLYLALSLILQSYVLDVVKLPIHKAEVTNTFVMPTPFNLVLWRVVAIDKDTVYDNFYHLYKGAGSWIKTTHQQHKFNLTDDSMIQKHKEFSHGFYRLDE
ncbi:hypothetical protein [Abyssogena phaseoliformis symbiont]|uniref:hypothetical protein n=1 Tax=Abyssogena phaseoliformis symbiont TaxID=596095 RepID=UPI001CEC4D2A|nr:hypothetical protein [Abyssogena phaseoliformis symbiont]